MKVGDTVLIHPKVLGFVEVVLKPVTIRYISADAFLPITVKLREEGVAAFSEDELIPVEVPL